MTVSVDHQDASDLYRYALNGHRLDLDEVVATFGWSRERVEAVVEQLRGLALLQSAPQSPGRYVPTSPAQAESYLVDPLLAEIERCQRQSQRIRKGLAEFAPIYSQLEEGSGASEVIEGPDAINREIARVAAACTEEICTAQPGGGRSLASMEAAWRDTRELLERGVRMRTVYQSSAVFSGPTREYVLRVGHYGSEVRTMAEFSERLMIFDRKVAFIPGNSQRSSAVVIRQPAIVQFLADVFERTWLAAIPFATELPTSTVSEAVDGVRLTIARLLAEGATDEVVARRVGLSVRTCRAHVAKLYEQFGAQSRCHLGVLLARSGLLHAQPDCRRS
ncbi:MULTISPECIES: helix-turn-helix transcriptional regulator [Kitasatospora]|uniref:Helix-turn-helix transcriptional regulator n=1 Tax=Kitasatospora cystarginea TaxID=58350 RepID=A0ABN3DKB5_9ACTN